MMARPDESTTERRQGAERLGRRAESIAAWYLRLKGYRIVARRFRTHSGEVDIVAKRGRVLVFVEVKARRDSDVGLDAVTGTGRARIARAAGTWLSRYPGAARLDLRFDVIVVAPRRWPLHLRNVFDGAGRL
jgi:putative endonuclease